MMELASVLAKLSDTNAGQALKRALIAEVLSRGGEQGDVQQLFTSEGMKHWEGLCERLVEQSSRGYRIFEREVRCDQPVEALVPQTRLNVSSPLCLGNGMRSGSSTARFGLVHVKFGRWPRSGGSKLRYFCQEDIESILERHKLRTPTDIEFASFFLEEPPSIIGQEAMVTVVNVTTTHAKLEGWSDNSVSGGPRLLVVKRRAESFVLESGSPFVSYEWSLNGWCIGVLD